jgi:hypothetical protein
MSKGKYSGISLSKELVQTIEEFIEENPQALSKHSRLHCRGWPPTLRAAWHIPRKHIFIGGRCKRERFAALRQKPWENRADKHNPQGLDCLECKQNNCRHIKFVLTSAKIQELIFETRKEG